MPFYTVWVASARYHKPEPLTYHSETPLATGEVVEVPLQDKAVLGFVAKKTTKPAFAAKAVLRRTRLGVPAQQRDLFTWLLTYYPAPSGQVVSLFLPKGLPSKPKVAPAASSTATAAAPLPPLTSEQRAALATISQQQRGSVLLHGNTGTGKTRVYLELAKQSLSAGRSAIILTPEIGLTPQLAGVFRAQFGERVLITHSHLSEAQRRTIWYQVAATPEPLVIIGPRSALLLPVALLGLIVVDEAHDSSYKQEQAPHYQTTRLAAKLAQLHGCLAVFGTATPLVSDYHAFRKNHVPIVRMQRSVHAHVKAPKITTIDRTDKHHFTASWLFSDALLTAIKQMKHQRRLSLIFLNRRGTARVMLCQRCGWQAECPHCDLPLTFHADAHELRCHVCGFMQRPPLACPTCGSTELSFQAAGTKALEVEIARLLPGLRVLRVDSDSQATDRLERQYEPLLAGKFDVLIGTQMVTKGFDLPNLGLVGIPFADSSLYLPDYTADEQTFQLLTQVIGRVGRTKQATEVIIQSYQPKQPLITAAAQQDWRTFYTSQLRSRRAFAYPPFTYLLQLSTSRKQDAAAKRASLRLAEQLRRQWPDLAILGPTPRFHRKSRGFYHWQLIVKSPRRSDLLHVIAVLPAGWRYDIDPTTLL